MKKETIPFPVAGLIAFFVIGLWGCLLIYAARAMGNSPWDFAGRQLSWLLIGCLGFTIAAWCPFRFFLTVSRNIFWGMVLVLALVLLFGENVNGMNGWFAFSDFFLIQPSEFAKPVLVLLLAVIGGQNTGTEQQKFLRSAGAAGTFSVLILLEPDFGSAILFFLIWIMMLWLQGMKKRFLFPLLAGVSAAGAIFLYWKPYARDRILAFLSPDSAARGTWHIRQFRYAMAEGGLTGTDHGTALWSNAFLPLPHSDSLYTMIVESSGCIGGMIVLFAFCAAAFALILTAKKEQLIPEAKLYVSGIAFLYLAQALIHIGVNVVLLPPTGLTLPLLSYGGSSLCSTMIAFGLVFSALRTGLATEDQNAVISA